MQVKEGTASFFAVVDKSLAAQKKRIEKKASQKQEEKKAAKKAAEKKKAEKETYEAEFEQDWNEEDTITVTASSIEELMKKINDAIYLGRSDYVRTEQETWVGGHLDFYG